MNYIEINSDNADLLYEGCTMVFNDIRGSKRIVRNIRVLTPVFEVSESEVVADLYNPQIDEPFSDGCVIVFKSNATKQWLVVEESEVVDLDGDDDECI